MYKRSMKLLLHYSVWCVILFGGFACRAYKDSLLFRIPKDSAPLDSLHYTINRLHRDYIIVPGNKLSVDVFANKGELIIDPNFELLRKLRRDIYVDIREKDYTVLANGMLRLPVIDLVEASGKTLFELEQELQALYNVYYNNVYVRLELINARMVVLRPDKGFIVPIDRGSMHILEAIAQAGGTAGINTKQPLTLLRRELHTIHVYKINLAHSEYLKDNVLFVQPDDVLYIPPQRRTFAEFTSTVLPILTNLSTFITTFLLFRAL